jgi:hypothetical protein
MEERRKKWLFYYCDSKWKIGHKCQSPKLFLLDNEEIIEELELSSQLELEGKGLDLMEFSYSEAKPKISLQAITSNVHPKTMRIVGRVKNQNLVILIDSGSTHNFLDCRLIVNVRFWWM